MAKLPALIDAMTLLDGRPRGFFEHIARSLRDAELIQPTKRGRGAVDMHARDGAALLLGVYGLESAAPEAIEQVAALAKLKRRKPVRLGSPVGVHGVLPPLLQPLIAAPTLIDGVAALIELAPRLQLSTPALRSGDSLQRFAGRLELRRPILAAAVQLTWRSNAAWEEGLTLEYRAAAEPSPRQTPYVVKATVLPPLLITLHHALFPPE